MSNEANRADEQSLVVNQLIAEFMSRTDAGEDLDVAQFLEEHSEHAAELEKHFANVDLLDELKETGQPGPDETILRADSDSEQSTDDATANTIVRGGTDSETSVTRDFERCDTEKTEVAIPVNFGRYAIQKVLGQGAMGAVYLARDTQLDRDVALKIPKFGDGNGVDDEELLERFYREARASATLRSPNICPVYDVGEIDGQHYITMAFIEGRPLKDFTKSKKKHSEKQIATTIRKLAVGLAEAHQIGVIHRDLKPANIMVDLKGEPVVMDFGLARRSSSDDVQVTQSGAILGTPAYMAPEQVAGDQAAINHQVDIYALGVIMYELITGEMPFKGNLMAILQQIALNNPTKPSDLRDNLDPRLEKICLKMMAGDQKKRYRSMNDVAADLQDVLKHPNRKQKKEAAKKTGPKPKAIPTAYEESNPALISVEQPKSYAEQLRKKKSKPSSKSAKSSTRLPVTSPTDSGNSNKKFLIAGGLGGLILLLGIVFLVRVGKYDVQITLDDPSITLSVDGEVLNIKDGQDIYQLSAGEHKLQLQKDGLKTHVEEFTVTKDGNTALRAVVVNGKLDGLLNGEQLITPGLVKNEKEDKTPPSTHKSQQYGLLFDSKESRVEVGDLPVDLNKPITIELWCQVRNEFIPGKSISNVAVSLGPFQIKRVLFQDKKEFLWQVLTEPAFGRRSGLGSVSYLCNQGTPDPEKLTHIVVQLNGQKVQFFIDGKPFGLFEDSWGQDGKSQDVMLQEIVAAYPDTKLIIGSSSPLERNLSERNFNGVIRQLSISNELKYVGPFVPKEPHEIIPDENTVALYRIDEGSGDTLKDSSGNGHHGKIVGAEWIHESGTPQPGQPVESGFQLEFLENRDHYVEVPTLKLNGEGPLTIEAFVNWGGVIIGSTTFAGAGDGLRIQRESRSRIKARWTTPETDDNWKDNKIDFEALLREGKPVHLAVVYTGDKVLSFWNGQLHHTTPVTNSILKESKEFFKMGGRKGTRLGPVRVSSTARYFSKFTPTKDLIPDEHTIALYKFNEGAGDILKDSSGNGHHGKIVGAKWVKADKTLSSIDKQLPIESETEPGLRFKPGDGVVIDSLKDDTESLTMECWLKFSKPNSHLYLLGPTKKYSLSLGHTGQICFRGVKGLTPDSIEIGTQVAPDQITHIAVVRDAKKQQHRLYVNGQLDVKIDKMHPPTHGPFQIAGKERQYSSQKGIGFDGLFHEARISSNARYDGESFSPQRHFEPDSNTLALYHFDEDSGDTLKDSSGNGHHGKIVGAKWVRVETQRSDLSQFGSGQHALAFSLDSFVDIPTLTLPRTGELTVEMMMRPSEILNEKHSLLGETDHLELGLQYGKLRGYFFHKDFLSDVPIHLDQPYHVAIVRDSEWNNRLYLNGKLVAQQKNETALPPLKGERPNVRIGDKQNYVKPDGSFVGKIDEVRISTIARYRDNFTPPTRHQSDADTLVLYHCDNGKGDVLIDSSGNGHDGKIVGAKWVQVDSQVSGESTSNTITPSSGRVDLVPLVDFGEDVIEGTHRRESGRILASGKGRRAVRIPVMIAGDYEIRASFVQNPRQKHNAGFWVPVANRSVGVLLYYGGRCELKPVGGKFEYTPDARIETGENEVRIVVRHPTADTARVEVELNGARVLEWSGPLADLDEKGQFVLDSFVADMGENSFSMSLEMLTGRATWIHVTPPDADADREVAEWIIAAGGEVSVNLGKNPSYIKWLSKVEELPESNLRVVGVRLIPKDEKLEWHNYYDKLKLLKNLRHLSISNARHWDGECLEDIVRLPSLAGLHFFNVSITDSDLKRHLKNMPKLEHLRLSGKLITDEGMGHLKDLKNLYTLSLFGSGVTDDGVKVIGQLTSLRELNLGGTQTTDSGLIHLESLQNLTYIYLKGTEITKEGEASLKQALPMCTIGK